MKTSLSAILMALLPFGVLGPACTSSGTSTARQQITCETDPGTGVVLSCEPGGGGGANTCTDVDEDGDGEPHDEAEDADDDSPHSSFDGGGSDGSDDDGDDADDDDHDGVPDDEDCDHHPGEDDDGDDVDLPYDVRPALGATTSPVLDAFASEGMQPAQIISVTGAAWRGTELAAGSSFIVTQDDCAHAGNRDIGRDRVIVTWLMFDGSQHVDHLDIRYCK